MKLIQRNLTHVNKMEEITHIFIISKRKISNVMCFTTELISENSIIVKIL